MLNSLDGYRKLLTKAFPQRVKLEFEFTEPKLKYCHRCGIVVVQALHSQNICRACYNSRMGEYRQLPKEQMGKTARKRYHASSALKLYHKLFQREYYKLNKEKVLEANRGWRGRNPEKCRMLARLRDFRKRSAEGSFTIDEWQAKLEQFNNACAYCHTPSDSLTVDHMIPITQGGTNDIGNIVPACLSCNSRKNSKTPQEWLRLF